MKRVMRVMLPLLAVAMLAACTFHVRESNLLFPRARPAPPLAELRDKFPAYRVAPTRIDTPDGASLYVLRLLRPGATATVLYFGGNGYAITRDAAKTLNAYADAPVNVVLVDHRGYGASRGEATLPALMADAVRTYDWLLQDPQLGGVPMIVHGHSLGSFLAGNVADQRQVAGLILEASVTTSEAWTSSLRDKQKPYVRAVVRRVVPDGSLKSMGNAGVASCLDEPVLFVVGAEDDIAPPRFSRALFDAAPLSPGRKRLVVVSGRTHMNAADSDEFRAALSEFVTQVTGTVDLAPVPAAAAAR